MRKQYTANFYKKIITAMTIAFVAIIYIAYVEHLVCQQKIEYLKNKIEEESCLSFPIIN